LKLAVILKEILVKGMAGLYNNAGVFDNGQSSF